MYFIRISEQTDYFTLSIHLSVSINKAECLLRGTDWVFKSGRYIFVIKVLKKPFSFI